MEYGCQSEPKSGKVWMNVVSSGVARLSFSSAAFRIITSPKVYCSGVGSLPRKYLGHSFECLFGELAGA